MAIDPADLKKIDVDLTPAAIADYDHYFVMAKGGNPPQSITHKNLFRKKLTNELDATGTASGTIDFTNYNNIKVTIDQDYQGSFTGIGDNETVILHVIKGSTHTFTPYRPVAGFKSILAAQQGQTHLIYSITKDTTLSPAYVSFVVTPLTNQLEDSLVSANLVPVLGSVTTSPFSYFKSVINDNVCHFEADFGVFVATGSITEISITIANWDIIKENTSYTSCNIYSDIAGTFVASSAKIKKDSLIITLATATTTQTNFLISGTFKVV